MQVLRCSIWKLSICNPQIFIHACVTMSRMAFPKTIVVEDEAVRQAIDIDCYFFFVLLQVLLLIVPCFVYLLTLLSFH